LNDDEGGEGVWGRDEVRGEIGQGTKSIRIMNRPWLHFTSPITPTHAWTMVRVESGLGADERVKWSVQCGLRVVCLLFVLYLVRRLALGFTGRDSRLTIPSYTGSVQLSSSLIGRSCKVSEVVGPTLVFRDDLKNTSVINQDQPRSSVIKLEARSSEIRDTSISVVVD